MGVDKIKKKASIRRGRGDRSYEEKRVANDYLGCDYKTEDDEKEEN
jgi:hypothetical protein